MSHHLSFAALFSSVRKLTITLTIDLHLAGSQKEYRAPHSNSVWLSFVRALSHCIVEVYCVYWLDCCCCCELLLTALAIVCVYVSVGLQKLLNQTVIDHSGQHLGMNLNACRSGRHRIGGGRHWLAVLVLEHAVQLAAAATIFPVAGRLAALALDLHVAQRTLAVEAVLVDP